MTSDEKRRCVLQEKLQSWRNAYADWHLNPRRLGHQRPERARRASGFNAQGGNCLAANRQSDGARGHVLVAGMTICRLPYTVALHLSFSMRIMQVEFVRLCESRLHQNTCRHSPWMAS